MWKSIGRFWEDVKRESTKAAHNSGKTISRAWEDTKRETTRFAHDVDRETNGVVRDVAAVGAKILIPGPIGAVAAVVIEEAK